MFARKTNPIIIRTQLFDFQFKAVTYYTNGTFKHAVFGIPKTVSVPARLDVA